MDSVESSELSRDGLRVVKGLCKSENFRALDNQVAVDAFLRVSVLALNQMFVCFFTGASGVWTS